VNKTKKILKVIAKAVSAPETQRLVPPGISVFDLIMPWKNDVVKQEISNLEKNKLSHIHNIT
jgi:hypothetical protein